MARYPENLEDWVKAVNQANAMANEWYPKLVEVFRPFVGAKILKVDGTPFASVLKVIPKLPYDYGNVEMHRNIGEYSVSFTCKVIVKRGNVDDSTYHSEQHTAYIYVANVRDGVLTHLTDNHTDLVTNYDASVIAARRIEYAAAQRLADELKSQLAPFGE